MMPALIDRPGPDLPAPAARAQRADGVGRLQVARGGRLETLFQQGAAKVRFVTAPAPLRDAVLINTAGGLAGGDAFSWTVELGEAAQCRVVSQACEKVYRSLGPPARVAVRLKVGRGARLDWMPQETILFDGAHLVRDFEVEVEAGGRLLAVEALAIGRWEMGERDIAATLRERWRVRREGRLVFADDVALDDWSQARGQRARLAGAAAFASILYVGEDAETLLTEVRQLMGPASGASALDGRLFCRVLAGPGLEMRRALLPVVAALRGGQAAPRLWMV